MSLLNTVAQLYVLTLLFGCYNSEYVNLSGGLPFQEPLDIISDNGVLDMTLDVDIGNVTVDWLTVPRRLYNNNFPGPTIRIRAGDRWNLKLVNNLQDPDYIANETDVYQKPNTTNLHTHGLHISSQEPQDNQMIEILPNGTYNYQYEVNEEQPAGTYWYHPHIHGSNHFQTQSGMHGMIIVEDDPEEPIAAIEDVVVVTSIFQYFFEEENNEADWISNQEGIHDYEGFRLNETLETWLREESNVRFMLVNGQIEPNLDMETGVFKRFRIVNTNGLYALAITVTTNDDGNVCDIYEIALDGVYLPAARKSRLGRSFIPAGVRTDLLIKCDVEGSYELVSSFGEEDEASLGEHPMFSGLLMTLDVSGEPSEEEATPPALPSLPSFFDDLRNIPAEEIGGRFAVEVSPADGMNREKYSGGHHWRYKAEVGTIQEMILTNLEVDDSHPIHMHINHMQVISYNKYTGPVGFDAGGDAADGGFTLFNQSGEVCTYQHAKYDESLEIEFDERRATEFGNHDTRFAAGGDDTIGYAQIGEWRDTVLVPPLSNITVRFRTHMYTGNVLIHCHLTGDADEGMMEVIGIVPKGEDLTANITSGGAYAWSCMENYPIGEPLEKLADATTQNPGSDAETTTAGSSVQVFSYGVMITTLTFILTILRTN